MKTTSILLSIAATLCLSGCLSSPNPFFTDADIVQDSRILGDYRDNKMEEGWLVQRDMDHEGRYMVRYFEGPHGAYWLMFVGTLFKVGDKTFLDLYPTRDNAVYHIGGGPPSTTEILHSLVYQSMHLVARIAITDQGVAFSVLHEPAQFRALLQRDSSLRQYFRSEQHLILPQAAPELRKLLEKLAGGDDVFPKPTDFKNPVPAKNRGLQE